MTDKQKQSIRELGTEFSTSVIFLHETIARKAGLSGTDHKHLGLIIKRGRMTAGELAKATGFTTGSVTGLIDRLEKTKLVKRQFDKQDRRKVIIVPIVENVQKVLSPHFEYLSEATEKMVAQFSEPEMETIEKYFRLAMAMMNDVRDKLQQK